MAEEQFELLTKLEQFFCSAKFTSAIGNFMGDHVVELDFKPLDEEQPLHNMELYTQYTHLIEQQLEEFIQSEGLTVKDVCDACAALQETHSHCTAIDYLMASTEYESFMELAYDHAAMSQYQPDEQTAWDAEADG